MPVWTPPPGADPAQLIEDLGRQAAAAYQRVEAQLIQIILDRTRRGKNIVQQQVTAATIKQLKADARKLLAENTPDDLAARIITAAQSGGAAAALHDLTKATYSPRAPISRSMAESVTMLTADLNNTYTVLNNRILRYPVEAATGAWLPGGDVYQQVISEVTPSVLLRTASVEDARRVAVKEFLARGVTGFQDKAGRNWTIGSYAEMATRTAVQRAYVDAGVDQMLRNGINLSQVIVGASACTKCGQWAGKIISLDGSVGDITVRHATTGQMMTVHVDATYEQLRASMWGHPNCRCHLASYLPGLTNWSNTTTANPVLEKARDDLRRYERDERKLKQKLAVEDDPLEQKHLGVKIRTKQARIREHVDTTGLPRKQWREQTRFSTGASTRLGTQDTAGTTANNSDTIPAAFRLTTSKNSTLERETYKQISAEGRIDKTGDSFLPKEQAIATWLQTSGVEVWAVTPSDTHKSPDALITSSLATVEFKTSTSGTTRSMMSLLKKARLQSGRIVLDLRTTAQPVSQQTVQSVLDEFTQKYGNHVDGIIVIGADFTIGWP